MKTNIISALLLAPVLVAQEPQSPIVHTTDGPAQVYSETRIFVNGKELTPQEVDRFKKEGVRFIKKQMVKPAPATPQPAAPIVQEGKRVFINGHELPPEVAAQMIENGIVSELQAPVHKTQTIAPMERPKVDFEPACRLFPAEPAARPEKPARPAVVRPAIIRPAKPVMKNCSCEPKCNCTPAPKKPHCCGKPAPAPKPAPAYEAPKPFCTQPCNCGPAPKPCTCTPNAKCGPTEPAAPAPAPAAAEKPACGDPNVSMKVYINGKEVKVPVGQQVNIIKSAEGVTTVTPEAPAPAPEPAPACEAPKPFCAQPCNCGPAPKPCTCTPDAKCGPTEPAQECITKPAEPDTPVLPTPALDAMPAPAPANPLAKPCEAKVIINGKEVMVPVDARHIKITIGEDGKPVVTPLEEK